MENGVIDLFYIGKDTFSKNISQLKNDKKLLKIFSQNIQSFINTIDDNKKTLKKIIKEMEKYSPMDHPFCFLKKFQIILNMQYLYFNKLFEKSQKIMEHLKENIDSNLKSISEFLTNIQESSENIKIKSDFLMKQNELILINFQDTENSIIENYFTLAYNINFNNNGKTKVDKDKLIYECHQIENAFIKLSADINNMINEYKEKFNKTTKEIKNGMIELCKSTNNDIINTVKVMKDEHNDLMIMAGNEIQNLENSDFNNSEFDQAISKYLKYQINEDDVKNLVKANKYKINIINKDKVKLPNPKIEISPTDVYNIVELLYSYRFEMIDKTEYNSGVEKNKLNIIEKSEKLLGYDFYKKKKIDIKIFEEKEIDNFINFLFSKEDYILQFLFCLNNFRANGNLEFSEEQFNICKKIFSKTADYLLEHNNEKIYYLLIITSQTFYKMDNGKKYFLQNEIKDKKFFLNAQFWTKFIEKTINEELMKLEEVLKKNNLSEDKKKSKINDIIFSQLISLVPSLNNFNLKKEDINSILIPIINKYNICEEKKKNIYSLIDTFNK